MANAISSESLRNGKVQLHNQKSTFMGITVKKIYPNLSTLTPKVYWDHASRPHKIPM